MAERVYPPDHVQMEVIAAFERNHAAGITVVPTAFEALGADNWRVTLTYRWFTRELTVQYRYVRDENDDVYVRQIHGFHGDVECWGPFCARCW
jgi:hypothetical protein